MSDSPYSISALKRSAAHFLFGKAFSAMLTITILLWLVRLLNVHEYATYITLTASLDIAYMITSIGLPWIDARYLPEFRLHATKKILSRFIVQLVQCQLLVLIVIASLASLCLDWLLLKIDMMPFYDAAKLCLIILVIEGCGLRIRNSLCDALLKQGLGQSSQVIRSLTFVAGLGVLVYQHEISLVHIVAAELFAVFVSLLFSLIGLWRYLTQMVETEEHPDWVVPKWSKMWSVAGNMYFSLLVTQVYSAQVFTLIIRYNLGADATAIFGFIRSLYLQVMSYLPAALLFGLIRPKLVASYVSDGGISSLTRNANLLGKLSLFILMPLLVVTWSLSEELVVQLSGGKFLHSGYFLAGLFCALVPFSQRQILETVAVVTGNSYLCNYASILGILTLPVTYGLIKIGFGLWGPIISVTLGNLIFCSTILRGVAKQTLYRADFVGFHKMLLAAVLSYLVTQLIIFHSQGWLWLFVVAALVSGAFLIVAAIIKPFSDDERLRINQLIKRNLFIW